MPSPTLNSPSSGKNSPRCDPTPHPAPERRRKTHRLSCRPFLPSKATKGKGKWLGEDTKNPLKTSAIHAKCLREIEYSNCRRILSHHSCENPGFLSSLNDSPDVSSETTSMVKAIHAKFRVQHFPRAEIALYSFAERVHLLLENRAEGFDRPLGETCH